MVAPDILDFTALLAPIAGDKPAGKSLRYNGEYDDIKEARRADDELPKDKWQPGEIKTADWRSVINLSTQALGTKSKDIQIAVWLTDGLLKLHDFVGLRDGLRLIRELIENYWDKGLYPEIEEDGSLESRFGPLDSLNQKLPETIKRVVLTQGQKYSYFRWEESRKIGNLEKGKNANWAKAAIAEGQITIKQFDDAVAVTVPEFYDKLSQDLKQCKDELNALEDVVKQKFHPEKNDKSFLSLGKAIDDCYVLVTSFIKKPEFSPDPAPPEKKVPPPFPDDNNRDVEPGNWLSEPKNRQEAFHRLAVIANYLKRVEPQHPVSYLLDRAVRWTKMPLEDWLLEVVRNDDVLKHLHDTLGIRQKTST